MACGYCHASERFNLSVYAGGRDKRGHRLVARLKNNSTKLRIDVLASHTQLAIDTVLAFHSTYVQNAISATHVLAMYPGPTVSNISWAQVAPGRRLSRDVVKKMESRGFQYRLDNTQLRGACGGLCPALRRSLSLPRSVICQAYDARYRGLPPSAIPQWKSWSAQVCYNSRCLNSRPPC